ncbi:MAG: type III pantothenate kinase [bacterium]
MVIVFDIGNTNITIGVFSGAQLLFDLRLRTNIGYTEDQYFASLKALLKHREIEPNDVEGGIIGSVVPAVTRSITQMFRKYFGKEPILLTSKTKLNIKNLYKNPTEVGDDRLANAAAGRKFFPNKDLIIIDYGTAVTFDVLNKKGSYLGGVIMPGLHLSLKALFSNTAKLPQVELKFPEKIIGNTTEKSIQSGIMNSAISSINSFVKTIKKEMKAPNAQVILTGGDAEIIPLKMLETKKVHVDKDFTLKGFKIIYDLNKAKSKF